MRSFIIVAINHEGRGDSMRIWIVFLLAAFIVSPAIESFSAGAASGTIGRKGVHMEVKDAFAYEAPASFGDGQSIKVRLADFPLDRNALATTLDYETELNRQMQEKQYVELEFKSDGTWTGGGAYYLGNATCGWCQYGTQAEAAKVKLESGTLKGVLKASAKDTPDGDGIDADLSLNVPISRQTGVTDLSKDGGEPAKAYRACLAALSKNQKAAVIASCFSRDDPWLAKTNVDYFSDEEFSAEVKAYRPGLQLEMVQISGGRVKGDQAELYVTGKSTYENSTGKIFLRRIQGSWYYSGEKLRPAE